MNPVQNRLLTEWLNYYTRLLSVTHSHVEGLPAQIGRSDMLFQDRGRAKPGSGKLPPLERDGFGAGSISLLGYDSSNMANNALGRISRNLSEMSKNPNAHSQRKFNSVYDDIAWLRILRRHCLFFEERLQCCRK